MATWFLKIVLCGGIVFMSVMGAFGSEKRATITVTPEPSTGVILNPGKGWVLYGAHPVQSEQLMALGTVGYRRFEWAVIEPEEGRFNWKPIDDAIAEWARAGKQFAFGVMCANSHTGLPGGYVTPKWVFDAGAKYRIINLSELAHPYAGSPGQRVVPVFDDPVFFEKLRALVTAMGKRYDGNPHIAYIDIRSYGNWGEGHMYPFGIEDISPEQFRKHVQLHLDAFKRTRLCLSCDNERKFGAVHDWAMQWGIAARRDGICGNSNGSETARAFGLTPAVFEFYGSYEYLKERGWWDGKHKDGEGYRLVDCVEIGKPSYIGMSHGGDDIHSFLRAERPLIERLANRMGYHFVLKRAEFPAKLTRFRQDRGLESGSIRFVWRNEGVAPVYEPCVVGIGLLATDEQLVDVCWPSECEPASWMPDKEVEERATLRFSRAQPGEYDIAIGLFHHVGDSRPSFRLGIEGETVNGWHVLGRVRVIDPAR